MGEIMAQKKKRLEEILSIQGEVARVISYADYFARKPLFSSLQIKNEGEEPLEGIVLTLTSENGMILPLERNSLCPLKA